MSLVLFQHPSNPRFSGARQGFINRANAGKKLSSSGREVGNKGKNAKNRAACPVCVPPPGDYAVYAPIGTSSKAAKCKNNHIFKVGVGSIPQNQSYVLVGA